MQRILSLFQNMLPDRQRLGKKFRRYIQRMDKNYLDFLVQEVLRLPTFLFLTNLYNNYYEPDFLDDQAHRLGKIKWSLLACRHRPSISLKALYTRMCCKNQPGI